VPQNRTQSATKHAKSDPKATQARPNYAKKAPKLKESDLTQAKTEFEADIPQS
jgi:hypothetical protein